MRFRESSENAPDIGSPLQGVTYVAENWGAQYFPLPAGKKSPPKIGWQQHSEAAQASTLTTIYDEASNWGIQPKDGEFVLDIDCGIKNGKQGKGGESLVALEAIHGKLPRTRTVRTPSGGLHLYFRGKGANTIGKIGVNIDTKTKGGYVLAPGSVIDGSMYVLEIECEPAEAPDWLLELMNAETGAVVLDRPAVSELDVPSEIKRAVACLRDAEPAVEGEGGDARTYGVVCQVRDLGISESTALDLLLEHYNDRCVPPWAEEDLKLKVNNAYRYGQNSLGARTVEAANAAAVEEFSEVPVPVSASASDDADVDAFDAKLEACAFSLSKPPPRTEPVLWIIDAGVAKPGDLVVIQAKVKSGKSAFLGAMMGCMMGAPDQGQDYLGVRGDNPYNFPVLHIDTEQSPEDHYDLIKRTLDRAALQDKPDWLHTYCVTAFSLKERKRAVFRKAEKLFRQYGGICAIFIDGVGDLCKNLNDEAESNKLVDDLVTLAIKYRCPVIVVLHENPGTEIGKTRGHFGSQLERKAASNLRLEKHGVTGVIQVWGEKLRRGHIAKGRGPSFIWSKEMGMHVTCLGAREADQFEAAAAFDSDKNSALIFLRGVLPTAGTTMLAKEINRKALDAGCGFADGAEVAKRFVDKIRARLADELDFKAYRDTRTDTAAWTIERMR